MCKNSNTIGSDVTEIRIFQMTATDTHNKKYEIGQKLLNLAGIGCLISYSQEFTLLKNSETAHVSITVLCMKMTYCTKPIKYLLKLFLIG